MAAQDGRRPVAALDQHAIRILVVQVERAVQGVELAAPRPRRGMVEQRPRHRLVLHALEETDDRVLPRMRRVAGPILRAADRAHRLAAPPGDEKLGITPLEPCPAARVDHLLPLGQQRRYPKGIAAVNPPRKSEKRAPLPRARHRPYYNLTHDDEALRRDSSSAAISEYPSRPRGYTSAKRIPAQSRTAGMGPATMRMPSSAASGWTALAAL